MRHVLFFLVFILLSVISCADGNKRIESKYVTSAQDRIAVLNKYFTPKTDIQDAYFDVYNVNFNNRSVPGASSWDYKIILLSENTDPDMWTESLVQTSFPLDIEWAETLLKENAAEHITLSGPMLQYSNNQRQMTIYRDSGIILIRDVAH